MSSDLAATVYETQEGFHVEGNVKITYDFTFLDGVFDPRNGHLASFYKGRGRCLAITDINVCAIYGEAMQRYFSHYRIDVKIFGAKIGEQAKTMDTMLAICEAMTGFEVIRKEPVLVVGGGLITDVAGFACAAYRRNTPYIRIPTTVIGLIDASVSIKVAVNHGKNKNRLGAYHAPVHTFLDFTFLRTLPHAQIRNGFAELIKISTCADLGTFQLLDKYCEALIDTGFGRADGSPQEVIAAADHINHQAILVMLQLEAPNLHELGLDRVIAYGHTWSPTLELAPATPLRHGHAISVDMAYSATLAYMLEELSQEEHARILGLFSRAGLTIDHELFTESLLEEGTSAILKTRDGKLRAAIPSPLGQCKFLNYVAKEQLFAALHMHKDFAKRLPRQGAGIEAYVDASDTGVVEKLEGMATIIEENQGTRNIYTKGVQVTVAALEEELEGRVRTMLSGPVAN